MKQMRSLILLEQYIINNGLSTYAAELINTYSKTNIDKQIYYCLSFRSMDFDLRNAPNVKAWEKTLRKNIRYLDFRNYNAAT